MSIISQEKKKKMITVGVGPTKQTMWWGHIRVSYNLLYLCIHIWFIYFEAFLNELKNNKKEHQFREIIPN